MNLSLWLMDWTVKSTVLFVAAGTVTLAMRHRSAALRHLVWVLALTAALLLPALSFTAPRWSPPLALPLPSVGAAVGWPQPATEAAGTSAAFHPASANSAVSAVNHLPVSTPSEDLARQLAAAQPEPDRWAKQATGLRLRVTTRWTSWVVLLWAAGCALVLGTLALALLRTRRLRRLGRQAPRELGVLLKLLAARLDLGRAVTLLELDGNMMPMTFGVRRPVVVIPAGASAWGEDRLRAVLLHELAHVRRYDCLTQLVARATCALYWYNPLAWVAARWLRVERELACDDLVLASGSRASEYATHLLEIARGLRVGALAGVASIAMARQSLLAGRLLAVLDGSRARGGVTARLTVGSLATALALIVPLAGARTWEAKARRASPLAAAPAASAPAAAPAARGAPAAPVASAPAASSAIPALTAAPANGVLAPSVVAEPEPQQGAACVWDARERSTSASYNANDDQLTIRLKVGACSLRVDGEGEVTFSEREDDVSALSRNGFFHIEERGPDGERRLEIEPGSSGLERRWSVNGKVSPYDDEVRAWLARTLLVVFRRTGFDAERRAERILRRGGVSAVLQEVAQIPSDYAARQYYKVLLTQPRLPQATLLQVVRQAGEEIGSDYELAELLIAVAENQPLEEAVRLAYVEAVGSIRSDFERHRALKPVLTRQGISREMAAAMLKSAQQIGSDFELAGLLIEITEAHVIDSALAPAFFDALASISSDFERHRVLTAVARQAKGDQAVLDRAVEAAGVMRSDFELASFLSEISASYPPNQPLPASFLRAAATINSGFELRRALSPVVIRDGATAAQLASVLEAAAGITSDFELAELLVTIAQRYPLDDMLRPAYFAAVHQIRGDFEHGRALKAVIVKKPVTEATVLAILESSAGIGSDYELAQVLIATAQAHPVTDRLRPAFLRAAERISSEHERGRVLSAIFPRSAPAE